MRQSTVRRGLVLAPLIGGLAQIGGAATVLVSANLEGAEGDSASRQPFLGSGRYQPVYAASEFAALEGPMCITGLVFRQDAVQPAFSDTIGVRIQLATTRRAPNRMGSSFERGLFRHSVGMISGRGLDSRSRTGDP